MARRIIADTSIITVHQSRIPCTPIAVVDLGVAVVVVATLQPPSGHASTGRPRRLLVMSPSLRRISMWSKFTRTPTFPRTRFPNPLHGLRWQRPLKARNHTITEGLRRVVTPKSLMVLRSPRTYQSLPQLCYLCLKSRQLLPLPIITRKKRMGQWWRQKALVPSRPLKTTLFQSHNNMPCLK